jgi:hypothetical protein
MLEVLAADAGSAPGTGVTPPRAWPRCGCSRAASPTPPPARSPPRAAGGRRAPRSSALLLGEADLAAAVVRRRLDDVPGDRLRAVALLGLSVEIELARGDEVAARAAADRLGALVASSDGQTGMAEAALAQARVAGTPPATAVRSGTSGDDRPHLRATISLELAELLAADDPAAATIEAGLALTTFDRLGATLHRRPGQRAPAQPRHPLTGHGPPAAAAVAGLSRRRARCWHSSPRA